MAPAGKPAGASPGLHPPLPGGGGNRRHTVELHLDALRRLGLHASAAERGLVLCPSAEARQRVDAKLAALGLPAGQFIHIHPTSRWLFKTWPTTHMAALIDALTARGWPVLLTAAPDLAELAMLADIQGRLARPVASLAGELTLEELGAALQGARLCRHGFGADAYGGGGGHAHRGAVWPVWRHRMGPWRTPHRVVREDLPCRPCGRDGCGGGKLSECLSLIAPARAGGAG